MVGFKRSVSFGFAAIWVNFFGEGEVRESFGQDFFTILPK